ncbi:hypothetical protein FA13DRAFT_1741744 [Coprinellus micaceus]|uniref:Uncharacterized protein n=1 Tax=Coprinellus micaceus TaxID=71717 RepID=A0A4Y7SJV3_COPMI|nr:hypothetical protein FA13DRAFT_1741744 [Coprinellus micaceus]
MALAHLDTTVVIFGFANPFMKTNLNVHLQLLLLDFISLAFVYIVTGIVLTTRRVIRRTRWYGERVALWKRVDGLQPRVG